ncbi:MAG: hypothetical protein H6656_06830 [Ardenticatenaceae bacterium]|nr:hypothetical protein [Ardenticatenaceae bacterium]
MTRPLSHCGQQRRHWLDAVVVIATKHYPHPRFLMYLTAVLRTIATYSKCPKSPPTSTRKNRANHHDDYFGVTRRRRLLLTPDAKQHDDLVDTLTANKWAASA